jgi:hypothetical protein
MLGEREKEEIDERTVVRAITNRGTLSRSGTADGRCHPVPDLFYCVGKIHIGNPLHSVHIGYTRSKDFIRAIFVNP